MQTVDVADRRINPEEPPQRLLADLATSLGGLSQREAVRRLQQHGPNAIERRRTRGAWRDFADQLTHPLAALLWAAAVLAFFTDVAALAAAIVVVILLNAVFAYAQERQAERATEALRELLSPRARVRRDGREVEIDAAELVVGDLVLLSEGDRLSADARLVLGSVGVDMAPLTGESAAVGRTAEAPPSRTGLLEAEDLVFAGTLVTEGEAQGVVYATGMRTQLGRIAALSQRVEPEISPLQRQVNRAAQLIAIVAVASGVLFFVVGTVFAGLSLRDSSTFAIGILVANVPEGLLPTITLALAVGMRHMARRRALVKRLTAVETLGSTDVICTDKTGTLTAGDMVARFVWTPQSGELDATEAGSPPPAVAALLRTAVRCNNASIVAEPGGWERHGDPSESSLLTVAAAFGLDVAAMQAERDRTRRRLFAFDARLKRMTTVDQERDGLWVHAKGAPLELLERCANPERERARIAERFDAYAAQGLRVLGFATRPARHPDDLGDDRSVAETDLAFQGLVALHDPPRHDVPAAVAACHGAGIRIIVITGDHGLTAEVVARQVGIVQGEPTVITGAELDAMGEPDLDELLRTSPDLIVARSSPDTKLRIVDALRAEGHTVAMTGDGVNDAPALRRADIGVAMGASGTDVAREAATMVLTDDNFASVVAAVREGRTVYENIRKFVAYIFAHATPEVVPFLIYALSGGTIPLPLTALQILAIDLGTETLPALALGREPAEPGLMQQPPRPRQSGILTRGMLTRAWLWLGLLEAALVTGGFFYVLARGGWSPGDPTGKGTPLHDVYLTATTMTFAGITACQVGTAFAVRTSRASLRTVGPFSNPLLLWGIGFELVFAAAVIYAPPLQAVFGTAGLSVADLAPLLAFPVVVWGIDELRRWALRRRETTDAGS